MEYLNIPTALFSSPSFIGAEPVQRATWIALLGWSVKQENGGVIASCKHWTDRRWMQTCGVTLDEINQVCELFYWDAENLHIWGYPHQMQATLQIKREIARQNGKLGGRPSTKWKNKTGVKPTSVPKETQTCSGMGSEKENDAGYELGSETKTGRNEEKKEIKEAREFLTKKSPVSTGKANTYTRNKGTLNEREANEDY